MHVVIYLTLTVGMLFWVMRAQHRINRDQAQLRNTLKALEAKQQAHQKSVDQWESGVDVIHTFTGGIHKRIDS
jgi:preprotein translocase subunit YajC